MIAQPRLTRPPATGRAASALLRRWAEALEDPLFVVDAQDLLRFLNPPARALVAAPGLEALGCTAVQARLFGAEALALQARIAAARSSGAERFDLRWARDGQPLVNYELLAVCDSGSGQVLVQAHALPRATDEPGFGGLTAQLPDVIIRYGLDSRATFCNHEIADQVIVSSSSIVGRLPREAAPPGLQGVEGYEQQLQHTLATGQPGTARLQVPHPDGSTRVHFVAFSAERDNRGRISGAIAVGRDMTDFERMHEALVAKEREFRTLAENSPDVIVRYDPQMRMVYCNAALEQRTGVPAAHALGRRALSTLPPGRQGTHEYLRQLRETLETGRGGSVDLVHAGDGRLEAYNVEFIAERAEDGTIRGALAVGRDITARMLAAQALAAKEREFRTLAENAGDHIVRWDLQARVAYANPALGRLVARAPQQLVGRTPLQLGGEPWRPVERAVRRVISLGEAEMLQLRMTEPVGGATLVHQIRLVPERDEAGVICSVMGIGRDVTDEVLHLERIEALVRTDPLTQLPNRQALLERAPALLAASGRHGAKAALLRLDLDHFKSINDAHGQAAGDQVLCTVALRLAGVLRGNDLLVRQGDDEFVVVAPDLADAEAAGAIAHKLQRAVAQPLQQLGRNIEPSASIGVALYPDDAEALDPLLVQAAGAMQHAKRSGRGRIEYYRPALGEAVQRRLQLEAALRLAAQGQGLELHLQPQVGLPDGAPLVGAEALLRWRHPELGLLLPDAFIGIAEEIGAIVPIGRWVLQAAAAAAVRCNQGRTNALTLSVNVSTRQLVDDDFADAVREALAASGCRSEWLAIEITESALLEPSPRVLQCFGELQALGVRIALDDFGTGYSALSFLSRFPVGTLKIDKSFVWGIERSPREAELVKAFIAMATALELDVVAEGVETAAQSAFLHAQGCRWAQGWLYGGAVPLAEFEAAAHHRG